MAEIIHPNGQSVIPLGGGTWEHKGKLYRAHRWTGRNVPDWVRLLVTYTLADGTPVIGANEADSPKPLRLNRWVVLFPERRVMVRNHEGFVYWLDKQQPLPQGSESPYTGPVESEVVTAPMAPDDAEPDGKTIAPESRARIIQLIEWWTNSVCPPSVEGVFAGIKNILNAEPTPPFDLARLEVEINDWIGEFRQVQGGSSHLSAKASDRLNAIFAKARESIASPVQADDAELIAIGDMARKRYDAVISGNTWPAAGLADELTVVIRSNPRFAPTPKPVAIEERAITLPNGKTARAFRWDGKEVPEWFSQTRHGSPIICQDKPIEIKGTLSGKPMILIVPVGHWFIEVVARIGGVQRLSMDAEDFAEFFGS